MVLDGVNNPGSRQSVDVVALLYLFSVWRCTILRPPLIKFSFWVAETASRREQDFRSRALAPTKTKRSSEVKVGMIFEVNSVMVKFRKDLFDLSSRP